VVIWPCMYKCKCEPSRCVAPGRAQRPSVSRRPMPRDMRSCTVHMWCVICAWCADGVKDRVNGMRTEILQRADASTYVWARLGLVAVPQATPRFGHQFLEIAEYLGRHIIMSAYIVDCSTDGRLGAILAYTTHAVAVDTCDCDGQFGTT